MPLSQQQEKTMLKRDFETNLENTAPEVLADEQLELVSGGNLIGSPGEFPGASPLAPVPGRPGPFVEV